MSVLKDAKSDELPLAGYALGGFEPLSILHLLCILIKLHLYNNWRREREDEIEGKKLSSYKLNLISKIKELRKQDV